MKTFHKLEMNFDRNAEWFATHHPTIAVFMMLVVLPVFILFFVAFITTIITIPLGFLLRWF